MLGRGDSVDSLIVDDIQTGFSLFHTVDIFQFFFKTSKDEEKKEIHIKKMRPSPFLYFIGIVTIILFSPILILQWMWYKLTTYVSGSKSDPIPHRRDSRPYTPPRNISITDSSREEPCNTYQDQRSEKPTTDPPTCKDPSQCSPPVLQSMGCENDTSNEVRSNLTPNTDKS